MASWTPGSRGELTFRDYVCLSSRDVLTKRQNDWKNIQTQATLHVRRWAAASTVIPEKGDKESRLSRLRDTFGQVGVASLSPHVPEIARVLLSLQSRPVEVSGPSSLNAGGLCELCSPEGDVDLGAMPTWPHPPSVCSLALPPDCFCRFGSDDGQ